MYTLQTFEDKVNSITEDNVKILKFDGVKKPVTFICNTCGKEQTVQRGEVLLRKGKQYQCRYCHNSKENVRKENIHKVQYLCKQKGYLELTDTPFGRTWKFKCNKCGKEFNREYRRFLKNPTCPSCDTYAQTNYQAWWEKFCLNHNPADYEVLNPEQFNETHKKIKIRHSCGFIWEAKPSNLYVSYCPKCNRKISNGEKFIMQWLEQNNIKYEWQYQINPFQKKYLYIDFYLPIQNIAIEYQGLQHEKPIQGWRPEDFNIRQQNDNIKRQYCKDNDIILYEIP